MVEFIEKVDCSEMNLPDNLLKDNSLGQVALTKDNEPQCVVLSVDRFEQLSQLEEMLEDIEIEQIIKERVIDRKEPVKMISEEEMNEYFRQRGIGDV